MSSRKGWNPSQLGKWPGVTSPIGKKETIYRYVYTHISHRKTFSWNTTSPGATSALTCTLYGNSLLTEDAEVAGAPICIVSMRGDDSAVLQSSTDTKAIEWTSTVVLNGVIAVGTKRIEVYQKTFWGYTKTGIGLVDVFFFYILKLISAMLCIIDILRAFHILEFIQLLISITLNVNITIMSISIDTFFLHIFILSNTIYCCEFTINEIT